MVKMTDYARDRFDIDEVNKKCIQVYVCRACANRRCELSVNLANGDTDIPNTECPYGVRHGKEEPKRQGKKFTFEPRQDQQKFDDDESFIPRPKKRR